ncbi:hypothetical protein ACKWTF_016798 [Chironomus riparius]
MIVYLQLSTIALTQGLLLQTCFSEESSENSKIRRSLVEEIAAQELENVKKVLEQNLPFEESYSYLMKNFAEYRKQYEDALNEKLPRISGFPPMHSNA